MMHKLESLKKASANYRKTYDFIDTDSSEIIGEISDKIDNQIMKILKDGL